MLSLSEKDTPLPHIILTEPRFTLHETFGSLYKCVQLKQTKHVIALHTTYYRSATTTSDSEINYDSSTTDNNS